MAALVLGVALTAFTACKKENVQSIVAANTAETDRTALVDQAGTDMNAVDPGNDAPEMGVYLVDEGISADFLATEADYSDDLVPAAGNDSNELRLRDYVKAHSFVACLHRIKLSNDQIAATKKAMASYEDCKKSAVTRARDIYAKLKASYKEKADRLLAAYKNGDITKDQLEAKMKDLRIAFLKELRSLQLQDKVQDAFKKCYRSFLEDMHSILTEAQWKQFVMCHKR